jgi:hypothetical protein
MSAMFTPESILSLNPSANTTGSTTTGSPGTGISSTASLGSTATNPLLPATPTGQQQPSVTAPVGVRPTVAGVPNSGTSGGPNIPGSTLPQLGDYGGLTAAGYPPAVAQMLQQFLNTGAGYNPDVANAIIAAMQPQVERGTESIMEQFGGQGSRFGSGAQIGLADYQGQVQLDYGQIFSQLYEQSVQNYLSILSGAKAPQGPGILGDIASLLPGVGSILGAGGSSGIGAGIAGKLGL